MFPSEPNNTEVARFISERPEQVQLVERKVSLVNDTPDQVLEGVELFNNGGLDSGVSLRVWERLWKTISSKEYKHLKPSDASIKFSGEGADLETLQELLNMK